MELELDSRVIADSLLNILHGSGEGPGLLNRIKTLMADEMELTIKHIYREANTCADALANIGRSISQDFVIFDSVPTSMAHLVSHM